MPGGIFNLLYYIGIVGWFGWLRWKLLWYRTKVITRDPEKTTILPFKSRILETDRIEKNLPSFRSHVAYETSTFVGFLLFFLTGEILWRVSASKGWSILYYLLFFPGRFVLSTIGILIGGLIGFSFLKKKVELR